MLPFGKARNAVGGFQMFKFRPVVTDKRRSQ